MLRRDSVPEIRSAINVAPLVDVCLVLLIIFMVVTPMLRPASEVSLPRTAHPTRVPDVRSDIAIAIEASGRIMVDGAPVEPLGVGGASVAGLREPLRNLLAVAPDRRVVIRADRSLRYGVVRAAMQAVSEAGGKGAALIAEKQ